MISAMELFGSKSIKTLHCNLDEESLWAIRQIFGYDQKGVDKKTRPGEENRKYLDFFEVYY